MRLIGSEIVESLGFSVGELDVDEVAELLCSCEVV
jgi:hypothetical protein